MVKNPLLPKFNHIFNYCAAAIILLFVGPLVPCHAESFTATLLLEHESPYTELLRAGLEKAGKDFAIQTKTIVVGPDAEADFRKAAENSNLVLVASDKLHEILRDNAANYRRVMFGSIDAGIRAANIMSVTFADEQAAFLAGAAAAMATRKKIPGLNDQPVIAWLSGEDIPAMRSLFNGFSEGAQLADPEVRVIQAVVGSFTDNDKALQKAIWLLESGADIIALAAGAANAAVRTMAQDRGAWVIDLDRPSGASNSMGTITKALDKAVYEIVASSRSGNFRAKEIDIYNLANKGADFAPDRAFANAAVLAYPDIERRTGELRQELKNGSIRLHSLRQRTLCDCLD